MFGAAKLTDGAVRAAAEGSPEELQRVMEVMQPQVRLMVVARLSPTPAQLHAVDDITQDVMLALTAGISRLENRTVGGLKAFTSGVVAHKVSDAIRRRGEGEGDRAFRSIDSTVGSGSRAAPLWQFLSASVTSPSNAAGRKEWAAKFLRALGGLKPKHREAITLAFFDQLSVSDIGRHMGISRQAASDHLARAMKTLRLKTIRSADAGEGSDAAV